MEGPIDACNQELKGIVTNLWKCTPDSVLDKIFPPAGSGTEAGTAKINCMPVSVAASGLNEYAAQFRWLG